MTDCPICNGTGDLVKVDENGEDYLVGCDACNGTGNTNDDDDDFDDFDDL